MIYYHHKSWGAEMSGNPTRDDWLVEINGQIDTDAWGIGLQYNRYPFEVRPMGEKKGGWRLDLNILCFWFGLQWTRWKRVKP